jgi:hypothetical protein
MPRKKSKVMKMAAYAERLLGVMYRKLCARPTEGIGQAKEYVYCRQASHCYVARSSRKSIDLTKLGGL